MAFELEGNYLLERAHTRRWVSIIAVVIPVAAFVLLAAWFIRAYIAPPTVAIPSPTMMADAPPPPPAVPKRAMVEAPPPPLPVAGCRPRRRNPSKRERQLLQRCRCLRRSRRRRRHSPARHRLSPIQRRTSRRTRADPPSVMAAEPAEAAEIEASEPIAGPVPVPRAKPHGPVARLRTAVPLPRPKPAELTPEPDLPAVDRTASIKWRWA